MKMYFNVAYLQRKINPNIVESRFVDDINVF
jgi:hypothetical protein